MISALIKRGKSEVITKKISKKGFNVIVMAENVKLINLQRCKLKRTLN